MKKEKAEKSTHWGLALSGDGQAAATRWIAENCFGGRTPIRVTSGYAPVPVTDHWLPRMCSPSRETRAAYFNAEGDEYLIAHPSTTVASRFPYSGKPQEALRLLESAPFEVASFDTVHDWASIAAKYRAPSFSRNHFPHGWGCAFKGDGHKRLVSRRWLEFGPWKLHRGAGDVSLVQFHAWRATARGSFSQAKPGHAAMGIGADGGYLQEPYLFHGPISGMYDSKEKMLRIVVLGRQLTNRETRDARAAVIQGALTDGLPLTRLAYIFPDPKEAKIWLHHLWLRELECWTIIDGVERRLDVDYQPTAEPPVWAADE